ncbi:hypothetical protein Bccel_3213 [Pseudobacteroides cellulosolvens ATCC 35603 = DSM 2933]|uniref:Uncharacterized protein n=1 Tax=Pseudobacteroides cellulosolvens ATCC 35603 = DSM 2933 TaxID=398512 RepID=A0A0L6JQ77_9FIRM|nr:hypothetical protein Bccel_3209 [Pseudobacteroides cellulosolvens ATCC 35603 = DSM 2933]KNY27942.1 hypothetical protein Bccel_3213 [Pseudobacteroides cellulosolvens ATCC 35603 = DSM 2933]
MQGYKYKQAFAFLRSLSEVANGVKSGKRSPHSLEPLTELYLKNLHGQLKSSLRSVFEVTCRARVVMEYDIDIIVFHYCSVSNSLVAFEEIKKTSETQESEQKILYFLFLFLCLLLPMANEAISEANPWQPHPPIRFLRRTRSS